MLKVCAEGALVVIYTRKVLYSVGRNAGNFYKFVV